MEHNVMWIYKLVELRVLWFVEILAQTLFQLTELKLSCKTSSPQFHLGAKRV